MSSTSGGGHAAPPPPPRRISFTIGSPDAPVQVWIKLEPGGEISDELLAAFETMVRAAARELTTAPSNSRDGPEGTAPADDRPGQRTPEPGR